MALRLGELATELSATLDGDPDLTIDEVATLEEAGPRSLSFFSNRRYKKAYLATRAGAVIVGREDAARERPPGASLLVVELPYLAFAKVATRLHHPPRYPAGVDPRAAVEAGAEIDPTATVLPFAYVGRGVRIGARAVIHAHCALLDGARVGEDALLYPGVVVREGCTVGARTIVQPGAILGGDGFGFAFDPERFEHFKVPQMGAVHVEDDVEIGANTCVDRGTLGDTRVGRGSKLDNLVQVAHNVELGPLCVIAGCSGIAGSAKLGMGVVAGGQVGIAGHVTIGDGARFGVKATVTNDVEPGATLGGFPAIEQAKWLREQAALRRLPELVKELRVLRKRVAALEGATAKGEEE